MISPRIALSALRVLGGLCAGAWLLAAPPAAFAQGRLDAQYEATLAGIPVGKGAWTIDISDDQFSASAFGGTSGLLKTFAGGSGTGAAQGRVVNGVSGGDQLFRLHHDVEENRGHSHGSGQRHHQGIRDRAGRRRSIRTGFPSPTRIAAACSIR